MAVFSLIPMKTSNLIWILVLLSLMLAVSGCGEKEAEPEPVPAEEIVEVIDEPEEADEPELPEEGVHEAGPDVTEEVISPEEETTEEEAEETETEEEAAEGEELTAQNYKVVSLKDLKAYPEEMHIKVGTTVEWRNVNDNLQHIIGWSGQRQQGVKPEPILKGESWSYTFNEPGKTVWFSTARPTIQGTIYVEE
jgi:plastocyanin